MLLCQSVLDSSRLHMIRAILRDRASHEVDRYSDHEHKEHKHAKQEPDNPSERDCEEHDEATYLLALLPGRILVLLIGRLVC